MMSSDGITIVGGAGFVGTRLCKRLVGEGRNFVIVDKKRSSTYPDRSRLADVRDLASLREAIPADYPIINLAAEHRDDVRPLSLYHDVNVEGARNICTVASEKNVERIVFTSSVACYGLAKAGVGEDGVVSPFNEYGRTKALAEEVFRQWRDSDSSKRTLVIVRPTVIFGEQNRGNVYNLLKQIAGGKFLMIGGGTNVKSMAYVENVAAFIAHTLTLKQGSHLYNYVDQPDTDMNSLVSSVRVALGKPSKIRLRAPYFVGMLGGLFFDVVSRISGKSFPISSVRVRKFCSTTQFSTSVGTTGFVAPVALNDALAATIRHEFIEDHSADPLFYSE